MSETIAEIRARHISKHDDPDFSEADGYDAHNDRWTLLRALDEAQARAEWQPIETAPRDGTRVLVWSVPVANYYNADEPSHVAIAYWLERRPNEIRMGFHSGWVWHGMAGCTFTHWQPLPTPPATHKDTQDE